MRRFYAFLAVLITFSALAYSQVDPSPVSDEPLVSPAPAELLPPPAVFDSSTCFSKTVCPNSKRRYDWVARHIGADLAAKELERIGVPVGHTTVAVVDSGFDFELHRDSMASPMRTLCKKDNCEVKDLDGHGTSVASMIGAKEFGVSPDVEILVIAGGAIKNGVWSYTLDEQQQSVIAACDAGAEIINVSYVNQFDEVGIIRYEERSADLLSDLRKKGCLLVLPSGNNGLQKNVSQKYFDGDDAVLRVEATNWTGNRSDLSSAGEILAPGDGVFVLGAGDILRFFEDQKTIFPHVSCESKPSTGFTSGTSLSSPVVAGVAGQVAGVAKAHGLWAHLENEDRIRWVNRILETAKLRGEVNSLRAVILADAVSIDWQKKREKSGNDIKETARYFKKAFRHDNLQAVYTHATRAECESFKKPGGFDCSASEGCAATAECIDRLRRAVFLCDELEQEGILTIAGELNRVGLLEEASFALELARNRAGRNKAGPEYVITLRAQVEAQWSDLVSRYSIVGPMREGQDPELSFDFPLEAGLNLLERALEGLTGDVSIDERWVAKIQSMLRSLLNSNSVTGAFYEQNRRLLHKERAARVTTAQRERLKDTLASMLRVLGHERFLKILDNISVRSLDGLQALDYVRLSSAFSLYEVLAETPDFKSLRRQIASKRKALFQSFLSLPADKAFSGIDMNLELAMLPLERRELRRRIKLYARGSLERAALGEGFCTFFENWSSLQPDLWDHFMVRRVAVRFEAIRRGSQADIHRIYIIHSWMNALLQVNSKAAMRVLLEIEKHVLRSDTGFVQILLRNAQHSFCDPSKEMSSKYLLLSSEKQIEQLLQRYSPDLRDLGTWEGAYQVALADASYVCALAKLQAYKALEETILRRLSLLENAWTSYLPHAKNAIATDAKFWDDEASSGKEEWSKAQETVSNLCTLQEHGWVSSNARAVLTNEFIRANLPRVAERTKALLATLDEAAQSNAQNRYTTVAYYYDFWSIRSLKQRFNDLLQ